MSDILCIYYSRTGHTRKAMGEIAEQLGAELVELHDLVERGGWKGYLRCGIDSVRKSTQPLSHFETEQPLSQYRLVIVGTPIWAGRCASPVRTFLKHHGKELKHTAYVTTRSSDAKFQEVYRQMDHYVPSGHKAEVSLRSDSVGYFFWQEEFLRHVREFLAEEKH